MVKILVNLPMGMVLQERLIFEIVLDPSTAFWPSHCSRCWSPELHLRVIGDPSCWPCAGAHFWKICMVGTGRRDLAQISKSTRFGLCTIKNTTTTQVLVVFFKNVCI